MLVVVDTNVMLSAFARQSSIARLFVITNDSDFAPLANAGYKPQPIKPEDFIAKYLSQ